MVMGFMNCELSKPSMNQPSITLPTMGCGTWAWGNRFLWGYNASMDQQLQRVFNLCVQQDCTLFDTGDSYGTGKLNGQSEKLLGQFTHHYIQKTMGPNSDHICVATKLAAYPWRLSRKSMVRAAQASAQRLGRNIDLVQMHWSPSGYAPWQERPLLDGLADLYTQGLVKGVGLSNYGPKQLEKAHRYLQAKGVPIITLQVQYSLLSLYPLTQLGLKPLCDELGIQLIAYSPLALGLLTGKYTPDGPFPKGVRGVLFRQMIPRIQPLLSVLKEVALYRQKTMAQVALNWCISQGCIPIPGAKTIAQAQENLGAMGWQLSGAEVDSLTTAATKTPRQMVQNIFQTR